MKRNISRRPALLALGAAWALGTGGAQACIFQFSELPRGYMLAAAEDAGAPKATKETQARCGADCARNMKGVSEAQAQAACAKAHAEGKCGTEKEKKEGKCGEAKCGGKK